LARARDHAARIVTISLMGTRLLATSRHWADRDPAAGLEGLPLRPAAAQNATPGLIPANLGAGNPLVARNQGARLPDRLINDP
jgi:hypothetical protein